MNVVVLRVTAACFVCACLASCASTHRTLLDSVALHEARAELLAADAAWLEAAGDGDVDQIMAFWTEDAVIDPPGDVHAIVGGPAIRELITKRRKHRDYSITWRTRDAWVSADGSTGCTFRITTVVLPTDTGGTITLRSPFCCVWRKDGDVWKCILDLGLAEFEPDLLRPLPAGR